jgi:hypothetical protein
MATETEYMSERDVVAMLKRKFPMPEYVSLTGVRDKAGWANRTADMISVSVWPSRGLELHGFEVKVSRSDWRRELKEPAKAEAIAGFCDRWWIAAPKGVVPLDELPATWGLLEIKGGKVFTTKQAPKMEAKELTRNFFVALLRRYAEQTIYREDVADEVEAARKRGEESGKSHIGYELARLRELKTAVDKFEAEAGVHISSWNGGEIGKAVKAVMDVGLGRMRTRLEQAGREFARTAELLNEAAASLAEAETESTTVA